MRGADACMHACMERENGCEVVGMKKDARWMMDDGKERKERNHHTRTFIGSFFLFLILSFLSGVLVLISFSFFFFLLSYLACIIFSFSH